MEKDIIIRPDIRQILIEEKGAIALIFFFIFLTGLEGMGKYAAYIGIIILGLITFVIGKIIYLKSMKFTITSERLMFEHGIINRTTEYMELYRIIDYKKDISILQTLLDINTITIMSGDRTIPKLIMPGISVTLNVIDTLRDRVEINKTRRGVYEITNRL